MKRFKVQVTAMQSHLSDNATRMTQSFTDWNTAYNYYSERVAAHNLDNAGFTNLYAEMELEAGGRGYDYRIELICE